MQNANAAKNDISLPVGDKPFWDQEDVEEESGEESNLKSIAESFVLFKSLKQSRDRWLYNTFPKFSSKTTRGNKAPEIVQPPHTYQSRARFDLEIGPHIFPDTILYEISYLSSQIPPTSTPIQNPTSNPYWQSTTVTYGTSYQYTTPGSVPQATISSTYTPASTVNTAAPISAPATATPDRVPTPLITSLTPVSTITPSLISQVNAAASANPILSNLLQLAAAKTATEDQLKTLGLLIQSLAAIDNANTIAAAAAAAANNASQQQPPPSNAPAVAYYQPAPPLITPAKPFDLMIEFRETSGDRWLLPRGSIYAEKISKSSNIGGNVDIVLTICLSNDGKSCITLDDEMIENGASGNSGLYKASLRLKDVHPVTWDTIMRWIGGEERNAIHKKQLEDLVQPKRFYLGLQLSPGSLLTQLQTACGPSYTMRPVRQGPMPQSRTARQRKPYTAEKRTVAPKAADSTVAKKPRATTTKPAATPIQCLSCSQTDVPLILGGRYCRPCVDTGKHIPVSTTVVATEPVLPPTTTTATLTTTPIVANQPSG